MLTRIKWILRKRYPEHTVHEANPFMSNQPNGGFWISFDGVTWSRYKFEGYIQSRVGKPVSDD